MSEETSKSPRALLLEIEQVEQTHFWQHVAKEIARRRDGEAMNACNLSLSADQRTAGAGASTAMRQLLEYFEAYKRELSTRAKKTPSLPK